MLRTMTPLPTDHWPFMRFEWCSILRLGSLSLFFPTENWSIQSHIVSTYTFESLAAREMEKVFGYLAHTPQRHQGMVLGLPRVSSLLRCGQLQLFSSRSRHFLQGAWYHQHYPNLYANPWLLIEHYFMRRSYARRLLRINSVDLYGRIIFICYWYVYSMISTSLPLLVSIGECSFVVLLEHLFWAMKFKDGKDILMIEWIKTSDRVSCIVYI